MPSINFLDIRLINIPIIAVVRAALVYGDDKLLKSFKETNLSKYKDIIIKKLPGECDDIEWDKPLAERRQKDEIVKDTIAKTNLFSLLKGMGTNQKRGKESPIVLGQYLHLRDKTHETDLHRFIGKALEAVLKYHQLPNFINVEVEKPLVQGTTSPVPDIKVNTKTDTYALEFHFTKFQATSSIIARYAVRDVIGKYIRDLDYLRSQLDNIKP